MKNKWHSLSILSLTLLVALTQPVQAAPVQQTVAKQSADVTGDGVADQLTLTGTKDSADSIYSKRLTLSVKDGSSGKVSNVPLPEGGYGGEFSFCDLNGDGVKDVVLHVGTGGSAGLSYTYLYTFAKGVTKSIPLPAPLNVTGKYVDNYRAVLKIEGQKEQTIDLRDRKQTYDEMGFYRNGKLLKPVETWVLEYDLLKPVDLDRDGICELTGNQRVSGTSNADPIAQVSSEWKWKQGKWQQLRVQMKPIR